MYKYSILSQYTEAEYYRTKEYNSKPNNLSELPLHALAFSILNVYNVHFGT